MSRQRYIQAAWLLGVLFLANLVVQFIFNWGLVTVKVTDVPIPKVISSIEWQGWVKIYSNLPADTKVTMYVDHVPVAEAMETLAANVGAQWKLGFFVAPNSTGVKSQIHDFETDTKSDDIKTYNYMTPLQMLGSDGDMSAADPRLQGWPGMPTNAPAAANPAFPGLPQPAATAPALVSDAAKSTQDYLKAFAQMSDIYISAPTAWDPPIPTDPAPDASIARAVKNLVSRAHGTLTEAFILRTRGGFGGGGRRPGGGNGMADMNLDTMEARTRNAISGLPPDEQAQALTELQDEIKFRNDVMAAPQDQRRDMFVQHMAQRMAEGNNSRRSPEKRAKMMARMVAAKAAATGHTPGGGAGAAHATAAAGAPK